MSLTTVTDYRHSNAQGNMTWTTATRHTDAAATSMDLQAPNISMTSQQHMEEVTNTYTENTVLRTITTIQNQQDMKKLSSWAFSISPSAPSMLRPTPCRARSAP